MLHCINGLCRILLYAYVCFENEKKSPIGKEKRAKMGEMQDILKKLKKIIKSY